MFIQAGGIVVLVLKLNYFPKGEKMKMEETNFWDLKIKYKTNNKNIFKNKGKIVNGKDEYRNNQKTY